MAHWPACAAMRRHAPACMGPLHPLPYPPAHAGRPSAPMAQPQMNFGFMRPGHGAMRATTIRPHHLAAVRGAATSTPRHRPMPAVSGLNRTPRITGSLSRQPPTVMDSASEGEIWPQAPMRL